MTELDSELPYPCPLCGARDSPLRNLAQIPIPRYVDVVKGKIQHVIRTDYYQCKHCGYMVFIAEREEQTS